MIFKPLDQLAKVIENAFSGVTKVRKNFKTFFIEAMILFIAIPKRVNFTQMSRFGDSCESRFRQNFQKPFDWIGYNSAFVDHTDGHRRAIAIDPSYIDKSGKCTPGTAYYWSYFSKAPFVNGVVKLGFNLVSRFRNDVRLRYIYTGPKTGKPGRPKTVDGKVDLSNLRMDVFSEEISCIMLSPKGRLKLNF